MSVDNTAHITLRGDAVRVTRRFPQRLNQPSRYCIIRDCDWANAGNFLLLKGIQVGGRAQVRRIQGYLRDRFNMRGRPDPEYVPTTPEPPAPPVVPADPRQHLRERIAAQPFWYETTPTHRPVYDEYLRSLEAAIGDPVLQAAAQTFEQRLILRERPATPVVWETFAEEPTIWAMGDPP